MSYTGRFAPSPSGRLHFGSLVCAVGSYLRARSEGGRIYLRIEDLDFYRCKKEYTKIILQELSELGFEYDGKLVIQSERTDFYKNRIDYLLKTEEAFYCTCTRAKLKTSPCTCTKIQKDIINELSYVQHSVRYISTNDETTLNFNDLLRGEIKGTIDDKFITLKRADNVIAYNLGCVADDIEEEITEVVRGSDLIDITPVQQSLYHSFKASVPDYLHLPLVMQDEKYKLSKQNNSKAVMTLASPAELLIKALEFLNQDTAKLSVLMNVKDILKKAADSFDIHKIPVNPKLSPI